ncbi:MAG TPA: metallophosphoesterase family protein [Thermomicrobiaceae bacterium]|nr:metallophosphoesterase family protein [Thermomicrobiaceae bacterium]
MRLAILADIHGNLPALEAVLADLAPLAVDQIVVAGDAINWGPFSAQVLERLGRIDAVALRGNHEFFLLDHGTPREPPAWRDVRSLAWLARQLDPDWRHHLAAWPDALSLRYPDAPPVRVVHGVPGNAFAGIYPRTTDDEIRGYLAGVGEFTIIAAHTHIPLDRVVDGRRVLNPGSVGHALDGLHRAHYLLLDAADGSWQPSFRHVPYDTAALFAEFQRQRFVEECGADAFLIVEEFRRARPVLCEFRGWHQETCPDEPFTRALAERFLAERDAAPPATG